MSHARLFCVLLGVWMIAPAAQAYGPAGHQMVGAVADRRLAGTPSGTKVTRMLDGMTLEQVAVIPDEIKGWDKNGPDDPQIFHYTAHPKMDEQLIAFWKANQPTHDEKAGHPSHHWFHYTDVPVIGGAKYADGKVGRGEYDIVHMISYCVSVLTGATPENNDRKITKLIAIILLTHFVGDIHQPLHVGAEYFDPAGNPINPDKHPEALADEGGNTIMLHLPTAVVQARRRGIKLHGFWDTDSVMANLPMFPDTMPKEEKRAKLDAAEDDLAKQFASEEPKGWREPATVPLKGYSEAWANEILPVALQAHERLSFSNIKPRQESDRTLAVGDADDKPNDGIDYAQWAAGVVRMEIHKAGWRLADLLDKALAAEPMPSAAPAASPASSPAPSAASPAPKPSMAPMLILPGPKTPGALEPAPVKG